MSIVAIRAALETALNTMSPSLITAWENLDYKPTTGTAYQRVNLMLASPDNSEFGPNYIEMGLLQVSLCYPIGTGPAAAAARAQLLRSTFIRGATFVSGGVSVVVNRTPQILPAMIDVDHYVQPVRIPFFASI